MGKDFVSRHRYGGWCGEHYDPAGRSKQAPCSPPWPSGLDSNKNLASDWRAVSYKADVQVRLPSRISHLRDRRGALLRISELNLSPDLSSQWFCDIGQVSFPLRPCISKWYLTGEGRPWSHWAASQSQSCLEGQIQDVGPSLLP